MKESTATLVIVRTKADMAVARRELKSGPCTVVFMGQDASTLKKEAGKVKLNGKALSNIAESGRNLYAPAKLVSEDPAIFAHYLTDFAFQSELRRRQRLVVWVSHDLPARLLIAVVEAVAVYPRTDIMLGGDKVEPSLRWEYRREKFRSPPRESGEVRLIGESPQMDRVREQIDKYASLPYPVLILGETGTGKDVVAKMLHRQSAREGRLLPTNAAALQPDLAASLLFGHIKGSFTGADQNRSGRIREAKDGTFFLDEVFNLHPAVQGMFLRALNHVEEGIIEIEPVGSAETAVSINTRLVVGALGDPRVTDGDAPGTSSMRRDLYYRVAGGVIELPPLRECLDDLRLHCSHILDGLSRSDALMSDDGLAALAEHNWPGNIRELRLVLMRGVVENPDASELSADILRRALNAVRTTSVPGLPIPCNLELELKRLEVQTMQAAQRAARNLTEAGRKIGMGKNAKNFGRAQKKATNRLARLEGEDE